jgi:hypothetical protein
MASADASKSMVCPSDALKHSVNRTRAFDLNDTPNFSNIDTKFETGSAY